MASAVPGGAGNRPTFSTNAHGSGTVLTSADDCGRRQGVRRIRAFFDPAGGGEAPPASGHEAKRRHDATANPDARAAPAGPGEGCRGAPEAGRAEVPAQER